MKTQMKCQKKLCLILLILAALSFVVALAYCTGALAGFYTTLSWTSSKGYYANSNFEDGGNLFLEVQDFNTMLMYLSIVLILAVVCLYITATNSRRNYYISNYIVSIVVAVLFIGISIYIIINNATYFSKTLEVISNTEAMEWYFNRAEARPSVVYSENTAMFIICFVVFILDILGAIALVLNSVWKMTLMKGEKKLLEKGSVGEVAYESVNE